MPHFQDLEWTWMKLYRYFVPILATKSLPVRPLCPSFIGLETFGCPAGEPGLASRAHQQGSSHILGRGILPLGLGHGHLFWGVLHLKEKNTGISTQQSGMTPWDFGVAPRQSQEKKLQEKKRRSPNTSKYHWCMYVQYNMYIYIYNICVCVYMHISQCPIWWMLPVFGGFPKCSGLVCCGMRPPGSAFSRSEKKERHGKQIVFSRTRVWLTILFTVAMENRIGTHMVNPFYRCFYWCSHMSCRTHLHLVLPWSIDIWLPHGSHEAWKPFTNSFNDATRACKGHVTTSNLQTKSWRTNPLLGRSQQ